MKKSIILGAFLSFGVSLNAAVNINWSSGNGGFLQWDASGPTDVASALDGGEIWQLIWAVDGVIDPINAGMPSVPSGDDLILDSVMGIGATLDPITKRYEMAVNNTPLPGAGTISAYVRIINLAPRNSGSGAVTFFDPSVVSQGAQSGIPAFVVGGAELPPTILDASLGGQIQTLVMIPEPSSFALLGLGAFLLFIRRKASDK
ncbi:MAG: hypothetical protein ACI9TH_003063 [Kiritimatiellia bacterium]|jgi:hypothetical protein